jgi:hypothetical protein
MEEKCVGEIAHASLWEDSKCHVNVDVDMFVQSILTDIYLGNKKELNVQVNKGTAYNLHIWQKEDHWLSCSRLFCIVCFNRGIHEAAKGF